MTLIVESGVDSTSGVDGKKESTDSNLSYVDYNDDLQSNATGSDRTALSSERDAQLPQTKTNAGNRESAPTTTDRPKTVADQLAYIDSILSSADADRERHFQCCFCADKRFLNRYSLVTHFHRDHKDADPEIVRRSIDEAKELEEELFPRQAPACHACGKTFKLRKHLNLHVAKHHSKVLCCRVCERKFYTKPQLYKHLQDAHRIERPDVDAFDRGRAGRVDDPDRLVELMDADKDSPKYFCFICGKNRFRKLEELRKHLASAHNSDIESLCGEYLDILRDLNAEKLTKITERPTDYVPCRLCQRKFHHFSINRHVKTVHFGWKGWGSSFNIFCKICGRDFRNNFKLNKHLRAHRRELTKESSDGRKARSHSSTTRGPSSRSPAPKRKRGRPPKIKPESRDGDAAVKSERHDAEESNGTAFSENSAAPNLSRRRSTRAIKRTVSYAEAFEGVEHFDEPVDSAESFHGAVNAFRDEKCFAEPRLESSTIPATDQTNPHWKEKVKDEPEEVSKLLFDRDIWPSGPSIDQNYICKRGNDDFDSTLQSTLSRTSNIASLENNTNINTNISDSDFHPAYSASVRPRSPLAAEKLSSSSAEIDPLLKNETSIFNGEFSADEIVEDLDAIDEAIELDIADVCSSSSRVGSAHRCASCGLWFMDDDRLHRHIDAIHNNVRTFACEKCGDSFGYFHELADHGARTHSVGARADQRACPYDDCGVRFETAAALDNHLGTVHVGRRFPCPKCHERAYKNLRGVKLHMERCRGLLATVDCGICGEEMRESEVSCHFRLRHPEEDQLRPRADVRLPAYMLTERSVSNTLVKRRPLRTPCDICGVVVVGLKKHLMNVHRLSDYQARNKMELYTTTACPVCGIKLIRRRLKQHMQKHGPSPNGKKYLCEICAKSFDSYVTMYSHKRSVHLKVKQKYRLTAKKKEPRPPTTNNLVDCPVADCTKSFYSEKILKKHLKTFHGGGVVAQDPLRLCPVCGVSFSAAAFRRHLLRDHDFRPDQTSAAVSLGADFSSSPPKRPRPRLFVACPVCGKETQKKNVRNHLTVVHGVQVTPDNYPEYARRRLLPDDPAARSETAVAKTFHRCPVCAAILHSKLEVRKHVRRDHRLVITRESFPELHVRRRDREANANNGVECRICGKFFKKRRLKEHLFRAHGVAGGGSGDGGGVGAGREGEIVSKV